MRAHCPRATWRSSDAVHHTLAFDYQIEIELGVDGALALILRRLSTSAPSASKITARSKNVLQLAEEHAQSVIQIQPEAAALDLLPWQHTWGSGRFSGVGADAEHIANVITV